MRRYHVVKLEGDRDLDACAATTMQEAVELLQADDENKRVLSMVVMADDAEEARLKTQSQWIWGMFPRFYLNK